MTANDAMADIKLLDLDIRRSEEDSGTVSVVAPRGSVARPTRASPQNEHTFPGISSDALEDLVEKRQQRIIDDLGQVSGIASKLKSDIISGLTSMTTQGDEDKVVDWENRIAVFGKNTHPPPKKKSIFEFMWDAVTDTTLLVLIAAAITDLAVGIYKAASPSTNSDSLAWINGIAILIAVVVIVLVNSINDYRKQAQFLQLSVATNALEKVTVTRSGKPIRIPTTSIVVGDILVLEPGDILPADGLLVAGHVIMDESANTGEVKPVKKSSVTDPFLISGCRVVDGKGRMLVVCVGEKSISGKMLALLRNASDEDDDLTPLQERLESFATTLSKGGLALAIIFVIAVFIVYGSTGAYRGKTTASIINDCIDIIITGITVVVIAVPEGLPVAVILSLGFTTLLMLRDGNLVRHLAACETMGSATTICSDKTGTLTRNKMTVVKGVVGSIDLSYNGTQRLTIPESSPHTASSILPLLAKAINFNSTAFKSSPISITNKEGLTERVLYIGSPSEGALLDWTESLGMPYETDRSSAEILDVLPFSSARKRMSTIVRLSADTIFSTLYPNEDDGNLWVFGKGAAEVMLGLCSSYINEECKITEMTEAAQTKFRTILKNFTSSGLRTLAFTVKRVKAHASIDLTVDVQDNHSDPANSSLPVEGDATLLAILGIEDPVRDEVPAAIETCSKAGITVRMVTGDALSTAINVAERCGILAAGSPRAIIAADQDQRSVLNICSTDQNTPVVLEGPAFRMLSPENMNAVLPRLCVLARSSPADKQLLVRSLQEIGEVVAVTGDGTNDTAALRSSDVGFSMGIAGTAMAKEASDIVILDDNFATLVKAVVWGRGVYDSIQKFVQFQLTVNVTAVVITIVSSFISTASGGQPVSILSVVQLLWINLIQDTFAALALATDQPRDAVLFRKPFGRTDPLVTEHMWRLIATQSVYQIIVALGLFLKGADWFGLSTSSSGVSGDDLVLSSLVFNSFVWCNFFNLLNCRVTGRDFNVFRGMHKNRILLFIITMQISVQILIVEFGGEAFKTAPLTIVQWAICIGIGAASLVFGQFVRLIPTFGTVENEGTVKATCEV